MTKSNNNLLLRFIQTGILLLSCSAFSILYAQHKEWKTGVKDTTYSNASDYNQNIQHFPFIQLVPDSSYTSVAESRDLTYAIVENHKLHIDAFTPRQMKYPTAAVLIIHGGGWRSGDKTQHIPLAQHLASEGIASFTVEYRLSTAAFFPAAIYDLKAAIRWLRANALRYNIDTNQINVLGFSAGGELAAFLGVTNGIETFEGAEGNSAYSSDVNAVIDIDGTLSFVHPDAWETQNVNTIGPSAWWIGYPRNKRIDIWTAASPLTYAGKNTTPFLFLNSSIDRMHAGQEDFKKIMRRKNVPVRAIAFPNTPHSFCLYRPWCA